MREMKRALWWGSVALMAGAVGVAAWLPDARLDEEIAAARKEGIWTETGDIRRGLDARLPKGENAAPLFRAAIAAQRTTPAGKKRLVTSAQLLEGMASPAQVADWRADLAGRRDLLRLWQAASVPPRLDYERPWMKGMALLLPEYSQVKSGAQMLVAAAHLGIEPRKNLLAAARIANLSGQEPLLIAQLIKVSIGTLALKEARRQGLGHEVEAALGPPIDVRWALATEPLGMVDAMRRIGSPEGDRWLGAPASSNLVERVKHTGPWKKNAIRGVLHRYRALWRDLPQEPTDYEGAAKALERHLPGAYAALTDYSEVMGKLMGDAKEEADLVRRFDQFERDRRSARALQNP